MVIREDIDYSQIEGLTTLEAIDLIKPVYTMEDLKGINRYYIMKLHVQAHSFLSLEKDDFIDVQTANRFVQVYEAVNEENKEKMRTYDLYQVLRSCWSVGQ